MNVRNPLVVSIVDLPRTPGSSTHHDISWTTPDDLGTPNMWVTPGTQLEISLDVQAISDGVVAHVSVPVDLRGECVRCLDPVVNHHDVDASGLYLEHSHRGVDADEHDDQDQLWVEQDTINLEPVLRDAIVTLVDDRPLCRPDCPGLCPICGEKWDNLPKDHHHDEVDPRFAKLASLLDTIEEADLDQVRQTGQEAQK